MKKKIVFYTGSRADYGLSRPMIKRFHDDKSGYDISLIVSGSHLSSKFGNTVKEIEVDGFPISHRVDILTEGDSSVSVCESMGRGLAGYSKAIAELKPHVAVVLGDRYEAMAFSLAVTTLGVPLAHLHGGEVTEGAVDDVYRHAMTKLSLYHFTATELARQRVIRMGEDPSRVMNVGALGVENALCGDKWNREKIEKLLGFCLKNQNILVTYHPETRKADSLEDFKTLLKILETKKKDVGVILTAPNADAHGGVFLQEAEAWARKNTEVHFAKSLGQKLYLSLLAEVDLVVGNSSSGILEAPALKVRTVNIGDRQKGRERAKSVFDCGINFSEIEETIQNALEAPVTDQEFESPYGRGDTSLRIKKFFDSWQPPTDVKKAFYEQI